ncbi:related to tetracenomycin polyketide synthesis hydroxylase tcmG [Cephalotrichum gorgonifer]|uniref:Related to tetracenomycin polyketide synthesis hydroxylase tcmG n=1 Tax=Cephalotrichum gorgonifer TaxID=2041049 RepID=A0AAE8MZK7_9PEZI|nr:related to tetracenomycin polyketide synthesis hydroxylase tcmG [Cephalotrichum gorgonifer]
MALELALNDVSFRIFEKLITPSDKSRALVLQSRSLELLRRHGITDALLQRGTAGTGARMYVNKKKTFEFTFDSLGFENTAFPTPLWISQADTEAVMSSHLESTYGVKIERGAVAEEIAQDESGVGVTIIKDGNSERLRCRYVVGCDGAHSTVRHAAGLSFDGAPYPQDFALCDAHLRWDESGDIDARPISAFLGPSGILALFPMEEGVVRLVASRPPKLLRDRGPESDPTLEDFEEIFRMMAPGEFKLYDPIWLASFRLHHRGANNYRNGRLFVAGDAAHIHSPAGGQGMNTGIQDAINLGWKLVHSISKERRGQEARKEWLDTYNEERHRVGMKLLEGTDRLFGYGSSTNFFWRIFRNLFATWILPWLLSNPKNRQSAFRFITELGIRYRLSSITRSSMGTQLVKGGDRAPDGKVTTPDGEEKWLLETCKGDRHHLILFSGVGAQCMEPEEMESISVRLADVFAGKDFGEVDIHRIYALDAGDELGLLDVKDKVHAAYGFDKPGYVFIRPDTYVACIDFGSHLDDLVDWLNVYCEK